MFTEPPPSRDDRGLQGRLRIRSDGSITLRCLVKDVLRSQEPLTDDGPFFFVLACIHSGMGEDG